MPDTLNTPVGSGWPCVGLTARRVKLFKVGIDVGIDVPRKNLGWEWLRLARSVLKAIADVMLETVIPSAKDS